MAAHPFDPTSAIGVDVGGTFTDAVSWDGSVLRTGKVASTRDQSEGVIEVASAIEGPAPGHLLHGTTVATNALLERRGAVTALITDSGFEDVIEIGRQDRPSLYDAFADRPEPLVPRHRRVGVDADGVPIAAADGVLDGVESIAVSLLYGFATPEREEAIAADLSRSHPGIPVTLASRVAPEFREFERASTAVLNSYLMPATSTYLARLAATADHGDAPLAISVMRSSGGLVSLDYAADVPAAILLSGPAGGVVAATALGRAFGRAHVISFDMGGTSTDVCRIDDGRPEVAYERSIDGYPCRLPSVAIHTVGAGGGSVAWVDPGGSLRVGPESAGAEPGPAGYGRGGTEPTVTDANIVLGRIDPNGHLAGELRVRADLAASAIERLGTQLGLSTVEVSAGVVTVVEEIMAGAIRRVSIEQGADPREATLIAFGGAGGLHAVSLARTLGMAGAIIPPHAGVFSALGLLLSPPRADVARSIERGAGWSTVEAAVTEVATEARRRLEAMAERVEGISTSVDVRYLGQAHEVAVPFRVGDEQAVVRSEFDRLHHERNGFSRPGDEIEIVTVRAEAVGEPKLRWEDLPPWRSIGSPARGSRQVVTSRGDVVDATVWWRHGFEPGATIDGPAVIEEDEATTFLGLGDHAIVHESGAIEVTW